MERRTALKLIAGGVSAERLEAAHHHLVTIAQALPAYKATLQSRTCGTPVMGS